MASSLDTPRAPRLPGHSIAITNDYMAHERTVLIPKELLAFTYMKLMHNISTRHHANGAAHDTEYESAAARALENWMELRAEEAYRGTRWALEPENTTYRVCTELKGPKGYSEVTTMLWMCELVKANALYECCVVAAHSGIHPGRVLDDAGKSLLFKAVSPESVGLFTREFDANDPSPGFGEVDLKIRSEAGMTCLHYVRSSAIAEALVRAGADVNARNNGKSTPLFYAEQPALVKTLLKLGADPTLVNVHNHTPAYLAASHGYWDVVFFLLRAGASATAPGAPPQGRQGLLAGDPLVLMDRLLAGVPTPDGRMSFPTNRAAIAKTRGLLRLWNECGGDGSEFEARAAAIAHRLIAQEPAKALADACGGIPVELAEIILRDFVGLFTKADTLLDPAQVNGSWHRRRRQVRGPAWTTPGDDAIKPASGLGGRLAAMWQTGFRNDMNGLLLSSLLVGIVAIVAVLVIGGTSGGAWRFPLQ